MQIATGVGIGCIASLVAVSNHLQRSLLRPLWLNRGVDVVANFVKKHVSQKSFTVEPEGQPPSFFPVLECVVDEYLDPCAIAIPPNVSVSGAVQYLKGKSTHKLLSESASLRKR